MKAVKISLGDQHPSIVEIPEPCTEVDRGCVHVVTNAVIDILLAGDHDMVDHKWKHEDSGLARYLVPTGGQPDARIQVIRTDYSTENRFFQGVRHLLAADCRRDHPAPMLVGVPHELFAKLCDEADSTSIEPHAASHGFYARLRETYVPEDVQTRFRGESEEANRARALMMRAAQSDETVLIQGETGTGKEIAAHIIHENSSRATQCFIAVNCGAITSSLFEAELFGHEPIFTGATPGGRIGLWEAAKGGTLFLDEIADIPLDCQPKVLRALQENKIRRVGGTEEYPVDVRIIAASCRNIGNMVATGAFREDLYYRLMCFLIRTPAFDAEPAKVPQLIMQIWSDIVHPKDIKLDPDIVDELAQRRWPGNFRDVGNFLNCLKINATENVTLRDVQELMQYYGPPIEVTAQSVTTDAAAAAHRIDCLRHLRRAADVLQTVRTLLRPIATDGKEVANIDWPIGQSLHELDGLLAHPLSFHGIQTHEFTDAARDRIAQFKALHDVDVATLRTQCRRYVLPAIETALTALFDETRRLESGSK